MQRQVAQPGVFGRADPVLAPGPQPVAQFQVSELPAEGAGGEAAEPVAVDVGEPQLRGGVRAFLADDDPHALRPGRQVQHADDLSDPRAGADLPVSVVGRVQACFGMARIASATSSVMGNPTEHASRRPGRVSQARKS
jgi:hypothetical protein